MNADRWGSIRFGSTAYYAMIPKNPKGSDYANARSTRRTEVSFHQGKTRFGGNKDVRHEYVELDCSNVLYALDPAEETAAGQKWRWKDSAGSFYPVMPGESGSSMQYWTYQGSPSSISGGAWLSQCEWCSTIEQSGNEQYIHYSLCIIKSPAFTYDRSGPSTYFDACWSVQRFWIDYGPNQGSYGKYYDNWTTSTWKSYVSPSDFPSGYYQIPDDLRKRIDNWYWERNSMGGGVYDLWSSFFRTVPHGVDYNGSYARISLSDARDILSLHQKTGNAVRLGDLARQAYSSLGYFDGNGIALVGDVLGLKSTVSQSIKDATSLLGRGELSKLSSLFLSFHYGYKLLLSDTSSLMSELAKYSARTSTLSRLAASDTCSFDIGMTVVHYSVYYEQYANCSLDAALLDILDLDLSPSNLWDLIPYSFVVDWFIGIGDWLDNIEKYYKLTNTHKVRGGILSWKTDMFLPGTLNGRYHSYQRDCTVGAITPTFSPTLDNPGSNPTRWVEAGALISSRM